MLLTDYLEMLHGGILLNYWLCTQLQRQASIMKEHLAIRRTFSLVDMITNTKFS